MPVRTLQYTVTYKKAVAYPGASSTGGSSVSPAFIKRSPGCTLSDAVAPVINNARFKIQLESSGVRVDAYWRPYGTTSWTYYGAQTSQLYSTGIVAQFNPFYIPAGMNEIKFVASGYSNLIVYLDIPN